MSVYRRGKKWGAILYLPGGKRQWVGTFDTKTEAKDAYDDARRKLRQGFRGLETIGHLAERWMDDYPRRKESTTLHYRQQIKAVAEEFGDLRLDQLDRPTAREWAQRSTTWPAARAMFSDAVRDGLCERNPFVNMRLRQSRGRRDIVALTAADVDRLADCATKVHKAWGVRVYAPLLRFAAYTGARPGELFGLDWRHVDTRARAVTIERQWNPKLRKMTATKNGRSRTVWLPDPALAAVRALAHTAEALFASPTGARMGGATSHYYWNPVRAAFGRPDLDLYELRHFYGTNLASLGVSAENIAEAMGHTDGGKLALERYIHATAQGSRAAIARAFGSAPQAVSEAPDSKPAAVKTATRLVERL